MTARKKDKLTYGLTMGALGVVYGDIGTSPLYALRATLGDLPINLFDILGILSLIFWSLAIIISIKYLLVIFRADNQGEGGIFALLALLKQKNTRYESCFYIIAIFGAGLLLGDGMLTPAISVTSAVEGLSAISSSFSFFVIPIVCVILFYLFNLQSHGAGKLGTVFGPVIFIWFVTIGVLGALQIIQNPVVLQAMNPLYGLDFLVFSGWHGYFILGGIFLVVTGGEALYADIGHFGKKPIRFSWFVLVFPALVLNYFGQGAYLLQHPEAISNPFYEISPGWFAFPLLVIATMATVIASQAVISATFSLASQAVLLGICPRIPVIHTSRQQKGQIYVPHINVILAIGAFCLLLFFRSSDNLTHAYGIAVNLDMLLISMMVAYAAHIIWRWSIIKTLMIFGLFICIDLAFLGANAHKFQTGGWVPVVFALCIAFVMYTWTLGIKYLKNNVYMKKESISKILTQLNYKALNQLKDVTSIFITDAYDDSGGSFLHFLKLSRSVPEHVLIVSYVVENIPYVSEKHAYEVVSLSEKVDRIILHYGFMQYISIPDALSKASDKEYLPFKLSMNHATYIVEIPNVFASKKRKSLLFYHQEKLFAFLMRNYSSNLNIEFYDLPFNKTIAIGTYCLI